MAKKMQFSVVGLPHYTIWHLYEPSVDDIKHMEVSDHRPRSKWTPEADMPQQMEQEKLAREQEEKEKAEKAKKLKESFGDATGQWEKDKSRLHNIARQEKKKEAAAAAKEKTGAQAAARKVQEKAAVKDGKT